jgi:hypothetical protein
VWCLPHWHIASVTGRSDSPYSVSEYSTRGGTSANTTRRTIGAPMMGHPQLPSTPVMFVCGADLVTQLGIETVDAGDLTLARLLEPSALIWIHLALRRGFGTNWAFGLVRG